MSEESKNVRLPLFGIPKILPYVRKYRVRIAMMIAMGITASLIDSIFPLFTRYAIDHFIGEQTMDTALIFALLFMGVLLFQVAINYISMYFAGMTEYNEDLHVPAHVLVGSPEFKHTLPEYLASKGLKQYAISETVKFGHITYYFNGNSYHVPDGEVDEEVPSYTEPFNTRPWMKSAEITDKLIAAIESKQYDFLRINYPGGDMVGHFGELEPTINAMESIDICLKRIVEAVNKLGGITVITADHGNAEELLNSDGTPKTAHTTNRVPCIFVDDTANAEKYRLSLGDRGLANIASTIAVLLGQEPHESWLPPIIEEE